jgi:GDP-L-fucose synthase
MPAMLRKFHEAKQSGAPSVTLWGSGTPRREFLHADDMADACVFLMKTYNEKGFLNIGVGEDISIRELAELIQRITGYTGAIEWDSSKPDGTPRKLMDVSRLTNAGWRASIPLETGIRSVYRDTFI